MNPFKVDDYIHMVGEGGAGDILSTLWKCTDYYHSLAIKENKKVCIWVDTLRKYEVCVTALSDSRIDLVIPFDPVFRFGEDEIMAVVRFVRTTHKDKASELYRSFECEEPNKAKTARLLWECLSVVNGHPHLVYQNGDLGRFCFGDSQKDLRLYKPYSVVQLREQGGSCGWSNQSFYELVSGIRHRFGHTVFLVGHTQIADLLFKEDDSMVIPIRNKGFDETYSLAKEASVRVAPSSSCFVLFSDFDRGNVFIQGENIIESNTIGNFLLRPQVDSFIGTMESSVEEVLSWIGGYLRRHRLFGGRYEK